MSNPKKSLDHPCHLKSGVLPGISGPNWKQGRYSSGLRVTFCKLRLVNFHPFLSFLKPDFQENLQP